MNKALALILTTLMGMTSAHAMVATGTLDDAKAMAVQSDKPLLVDFFTEW